MKCTSCGGENIERGFIPDFSAAAVWIGLWMRGEPTTQKSFWERVRSGAGVDVSGGEVLAIEAHRCTACGHLELFARQPPQAGTSVVS